MLLQFTVENVLSFRDETVLSLLAAPGVEHAPGQVIEVPGLPRPVLRVLALYGANASGKSNLVKAMHTAALLVLAGTRPDDPIAVVPFKLDPEAKRNPSRFEFELWIAGCRWSYGFACTIERVVAEWLYRDTGGGERSVFERTLEDDGRMLLTIGDGVPLDDERRRFWEFVAEGTRANQLFMTEARERNVGELEPLLTTFVSGMAFATAGAKIDTLPRLMLKDSRLLSFASSLVHAAGTGVHQLELVVDHSEAESKLDPAVTRTAESVVAVMRDSKSLRIRYRHLSNGVETALESSEESDGTCRVVELSPLLFLAIKEGKSVVIDELDRSLHTLLSRNLIERFLSADPATSGQLIFTTHDTNLLDLTLLPYDSIWFVEKGRSGASTLYSLAEFKPEQLAQLGNKVESGYLHGRFGGTPFLSNPRVAKTPGEGTP